MCVCVWFGDILPPQCLVASPTIMLLAAPSTRCGIRCCPPFFPSLFPPSFATRYVCMSASVLRCWSESVTQSPNRLAHHILREDTLATHVCFSPGAVTGRRPKTVWCAVMSVPLLSWSVFSLFPYCFAIGCLHTCPQVYLCLLPDLIPSHTDSYPPAFSLPSHMCTHTSYHIVSSVH
jgi:hypothetical protein